MSQDWLEDLTNVDAQVEAAIRSSYESKSQQVLLENLEKFISKKDSEVQKFCNFRVRATGAL